MLYIFTQTEKAFCHIYLSFCILLLRTYYDLLTSAHLCYSWLFTSASWTSGFNLSALVSWTLVRTSCCQDLIFHPQRIRFIFKKLKCFFFLLEQIRLHDDGNKCWKKTFILWISQKVTNFSAANLEISWADDGETSTGDVSMCPLSAQWFHFQQEWACSATCDGTTWLKSMTEVSESSGHV